MKKVKIMLTAISVLAVVGGALALKAKKFNTICYYSLVGTTCRFKANVTTLPLGGTIFNTTIAVPPQGCPTTVNTVDHCKIQHLTAVGDN